MDAEITREITGKDTIPAGTAATGTVTTNAADSTLLTVTGGVYSEWAKLTELSYNNIWIYLITAHKLARVTGIYKKSDSAFTLILDRAMAGIAGDTFKIVEANLVHFSVTNDSGGAEGTYNDVQFVVGKTFFEDRDSRAANSWPKWKEPERVDGTGTTLVVSETR